MQNNDNFIKAYQNFEITIKSAGFESVKAYEDSFIDSNKLKSEKIRICRTIRNFIVHQDSSFIEASKEMIDFLIDEVSNLDEGQIPIKKKMIPIRYGVHDTDLITSALDYMLKKKLNVLPVFDKNNYAIGIFTFKDLAAYVALGDYNKSKKVSNIVRKSKLNFANENTPFIKIKELLIEPRETVYLVISDDKKVIGWIS